jgi:hypothetical protein
MLRYLFLCIFLQGTLIHSSYAQQAEVLGGCFYNNTTNRVTVRIAIRNKTNNATSMEFTGMRFGFQYNENAVNYVGYRSYMNSSSGNKLDDVSFLSVIGPDTGPSPAVGTESTSSRTANIYSGGTKVLQRRFINRSTSDCNNVMVLQPNQSVILIDIFFTLDGNNPSYYKLNVPGYGFDSPEFIAQFLTSHEGVLKDNFKEIAVVVIRTANGDNNVYQPFDMQNCANGNVNPITISGNDINFISPINNAILKGNFDQVYLNDQKNAREIRWEYLNNELVKHFEIEGARSNGEYKLVKKVSSSLKSGKAVYQWSDNANNEYSTYRIKAVMNDGDVDISQTLKVFKNAKALAIYPNPVINDLQVVLPNSFSNARYNIYSSTGLLVKQFQKAGQINRIGVNELFPGLYLFEVTDLQTGERLVTPFQKQ